LRTAIVEKEHFPREKVCGDCVNPGCWPVLERLGAAQSILALPHAKIRQVDFVDRKNRSISVPIGDGKIGEIAIKRSLLDQVLLETAVRNGAEGIQGESVRGLAAGWRVQIGRRSLSARVLVAADGRNSTVSRLLGIAPALSRDRVALQIHLGAKGAGMEGRIVLRQLDWGYCGISDVGAGEINVCLVGEPEAIPALKSWAMREFSLAGERAWRTITPIKRKPVPVRRPGLLLVGDAARVVEPFTGEGIYYALASGELAGREIVAAFSTGDCRFESYSQAHARLYRGRLWINRLARSAMVQPWIGDLVYFAARASPGLLRHLTGKVVGST
jgi:flavin-dependent dehydrogenase